MWVPRRTYMFQVISVSVETVTWWHNIYSVLKLQKGNLIHADIELFILYAQQQRSLEAHLHIRSFMKKIYFLAQWSQMEKNVVNFIFAQWCQIAGKWPKCFFLPLLSKI